MHWIKIRTDGKLIRTIKQGILLIGVSMTFIPQLFYWYGLKTIQMNQEICNLISLTGSLILVPFIVYTYIYSRYSPILYLKIRKKIIIFTREFTKKVDDGTMIHSVMWRCRITDNKIVITLYSRGLILNETKTAREFTEYVALNLLQFQNKEGEFIFTYGERPARFDGMEILNNVEL